MLKDSALIQRLLALNKPYFTVADLEKVLDQRRPSLYVTLHRLVDYNTLVYPSYLSFESALSRYGILSQVPYTLTFATPRRSRHLTLGETSVQFHQVKGDLFFGYTLVDGLYVAEPEKALLDQAYLASRGLAELTWEELDLAALDQGRLRDYAGRFPPAVRARIRAGLR
jgi:predicted transcriptional regulator of viral defense system